MSRLRVVPIVEGHGEDQAIRTLLQRIWTDLLGGEYLEVLKPIRGKRYGLVREDELDRAISLALLKLGPATSAGLVLVLLDADKDLPCVLGPELTAKARKSHGNADVACVVANVEYETWFVAAAESLAAYLEIPHGVSIPDDPERERSGKGWIKRFFKGVKYSETVDQPRLTAKMDLALCRRRSASFDKLCRELEKRLQRVQD